MLTTRVTLIDRVRDVNDQQSWKEFFQIYVAVVESYARSRGLSATDVEEVTSQCMQRLVRKLPEFEYDQARGRFRSWLSAMVNNLVTDLHRKKLPEYRDDSMSSAAGVTLSPEQLWEQHWRQEHVRYALQLLRKEVSEQHYEAFRLYVLEQNPAQEVARLLSLSANNLYVIKARLITRLGEILRSLPDNDCESLG